MYKPYELPLPELKEAWRFVCYLNTEIPEPEPDSKRMMQMMNDMSLEIKKLKSTLG
jgi:hypothetical protein